MQIKGEKEKKSTQCEGAKKQDDGNEAANTALLEI